MADASALSDSLRTIAERAEEVGYDYEYQWIEPDHANNPHSQRDAILTSVYDPVGHDKRWHDLDGRCSSILPANASKLRIPDDVIPEGYNRTMGEIRAKANDPDYKFRYSMQQMLEDVGASD